MTPRSCRPGLPPASTTTATTSQTTIPAPPTPPTCSIKSSRRGRTFTCWPATSPTRIRPDWASPQPSCRRPPTPRRVSTSSTPTSGTCTSGPSKPAPQQHRGCSPLATTTWRPPTRPTATVDIWPGWTFPTTAPPPARRCTRSCTAMSLCCPWTPTTSATKSKPTPATRAAAKTRGWHAHWLRTAPTPTSTSSCVSSTTARTPPPRRTPATAECGQPGVICSTATRSTWYSRATIPTTVATDNAVVYPETDGTVYYIVGCAGRPRYTFQPGELESYRGNELTDTFVPNSYLWTARGDRHEEAVGWSRVRFANYAFIRVDVRPGAFISEMDVVAVDEYGGEFDKLTYRRQ